VKTMNGMEWWRREEEWWMVDVGARGKREE
jgi:hypothetical protein